MKKKSVYYYHEGERGVGWAFYDAKKALVLPVRSSNPARLLIFNVGSRRHAYFLQLVCLILESMFGTTYT